MMNLEDDQDNTLNEASSPFLPTKALFLSLQSLFLLIASLPTSQPQSWLQITDF